MSGANVATRKRVRLALAVYVIGFSLGIAEHARDFLVHGWRPYNWGVAPLEWFWTSLILLDALVVGLLLTGRRRPGLSLALAIMVLDVAANSYAMFERGFSAFALPLVMQTGFFGYVLGSIAFLW